MKWTNDEAKELLWSKYQYIDKVYEIKSINLGLGTAQLYEDETNERLDVAIDVLIGGTKYLIAQK